MARATTISALSAVLLAGLAHAQSTNTTCQATYSWLKNAQGQDPCLLASYLSMPCSGSQGNWNSQPLDPDQYYLSPTAENANPCLCSAVFYAVVSACAYCQGAVVSTWYQWIPNCSAYQSQTYPVSVVSGTSIPGWATLPVPASGTWDATTAYNYALSASASITLGGSTTAALTPAAGSTVISLPSISKTSTGPASTQSSNSSGSSIIGAAVGGTIGGLGLLAGIGFLIWYFCLRKPSGDQSIKNTPDALDDEGKINTPPIQVQPWNPVASSVHPTNASYYSNAPTPAPQPTSPPPPSGISYASPQTYAPQPSQYSGPGSESGGPTTYSESNSGYGGVPQTVTYGVANPGPNQYPIHDPNQYSQAPTAYNPYNNPVGTHQQPATANPLLEGFDGGMHAPPPRYETPAPGSSMMGAGAAGATGWPNEKR